MTTQPGGGAAYTTVGTSSTKIDAAGLAAGTELFTADYAVADPVHVSFLYSEVPFADIIDIRSEKAEALDGVVGVFHFRNSPQGYYTTAGQGFPEPSPYDTRLFDTTVRFVGDRICMVAAETKEIADRAIGLIEVDLEEYEALFDAEKATDPAAPLLHSGDEHAAIPVPYEPEQNTAARMDLSIGDVDGAMQEADFTVEERYSMHFASHCALEPHVVAAYFDPRDRLTIVSATQVPFHARRIVSRLLDIPLYRIRVIKPRIGGGFGGKQEVILEPYAALVAMRTGRNVRIEYSRKEVFLASRTRHPMRITLKAGAQNDGSITGLSMDVRSNTGAYGAHALTVLSNVGAKVLPLFNKIQNLSFTGKAVYTNLPVPGAYRGYGATQGYFALNQHLDIIARRVGIDPVEFCKAWHIREGESSPIFKALGEGTEGVEQVVGSCKLSECLDAGAEAIGWKEKRGRGGLAAGARGDGAAAGDGGAGDGAGTGDGAGAEGRSATGQRARAGDRTSAATPTGRGDRVRGVGLAIAMQGSGIPKIDMGSATLKLNEDGSFNLLVGATDIGTGSDTVLAQIAAEALKVPAEKIQVLSSDTDLTPFDVGAYASSTTYVSGTAVQMCADRMVAALRSVAAEIVGRHSDPGADADGPAGGPSAGAAADAADGLLHEAESFRDADSGKQVTFSEIAYRRLYSANHEQLQTSASFSGEMSPAPFIAQFAEVEVDLRTGDVTVIEFVSAVDCGQAINPALAEGQVEGAAVNGISYALTEEFLFDEKGRLRNPSFGHYKIYTAADMPAMRTIIVPSHEPSGPFGAKSVGEIGINGAAPAIANAIFDATGVRLFDTPFTPERVYRALQAAGVTAGAAGDGAGAGVDSRGTAGDGAGPGGDAGDGAAADSGGAAADKGGTS